VLEPESPGPPGPVGPPPLAPPAPTVTLRGEPGFETFVAVLTPPAPPPDP
jgi:hypothetical protein